MPQDVPLDTEIVRDHVKFGRLRLRELVGNGDGLNAFRPGVAIGSADFRYEVLSGHAGTVSHGLDEIVDIVFADGDNTAHGATLAKVADKAASVDIRDDRNAVFAEKVIRGIIRAPVADDG